MDVGFLGLGQMGAAIAERLESDDVRLHVFDPNPVAVAPFVLRGAVDQGSPSRQWRTQRRSCSPACRPARSASRWRRKSAGSPALRIYVEMSTIGSAAMARIAHRWQRAASRWWTARSAVDRKARAPERCR